MSIKRIRMRIKLDKFKSNTSKKYNLLFGYIAKAPKVSASKAKVKILTALKAGLAESVFL